MNTSSSSLTDKLSIQSFIPYFLLTAFLVVASLFGRIFLETNAEVIFESEFQVFVLGTILFVGFLINRIAPQTIVPSFVWVIFAGIALEPLVGIFTRDISILRIVMELFAAIILFSGGIEIPFKNFKEWFFPIATLSFLGVILTSIIFSAVMYGLAVWLNIYEPGLMPSIVILSIALSSTDPTAIIPMLNVMKFKRTFIKEIAISESALTDISGSILTRFLLVAFLTTPVIGNNVFNYFAPLAAQNTYEAFALQIVSGILVGYVGYRLMKSLYSMKTPGRGSHSKTDPALFLSIPVFTFVVGNLLGGAGFLAAFVAGLLTDISGEVKEAFVFNESLLNHLIFPFIFIILGALVPLDILLAYAPIGILATIIFVLLLRPFVVLCSLFPWLLNHRFQFEDLIFLAMIRETGIIAAVLLVIASSYNIIESDCVIAVGMWVILLTLIIEPPLTPILSKKIGITK